MERATTISSGERNPHQSCVIIGPYKMSCFQLLYSFCDELGKMRTKFWWGQRREENKIYWISWSKMCKPKGEGGLGVKDLCAFNMALLAKQSWWLMNCRTSLLYKLYRAKYFSQSTFMEAQVGPNPSFTWRGIVRVRSVLNEGCCWEVGNGRSINI